MKLGTTVSIFTYNYLHRLRDRLPGRLTLTAVSDEETFGPWGARYLMEHHPEVHSDCMLNAEPSTPLTVRFGEKGVWWLTLTIRTEGGHGAYTHLSESATKTAARIVADLESLTELEPAPPEEVRRAIEAGRAAMTRALGRGAGDIVPKVTLNIGRIEGGVKMNMIPGLCRVDVDLRLPLGMDREDLRPSLERILAKYPNVTLEEVNYNPPSWCEPAGEMMGIIQDNVERLRGFRPTPVVSVGGTDARLWRYAGVPAYVYGPYPHGMGTADEYVEIDDMMHILRTHVLSAYDYLTAAPGGRPGG